MSRIREQLVSINPVRRKELTFFPSAILPRSNCEIRVIKSKTTKDTKSKVQLILFRTLLFASSLNIGKRIEMTDTDPSFIA